jgi:putative transcriptional regulator
MQDPNFSRAVVLLAEYGPHGAFGLIVNHQMTEPASDVVTPEPPMRVAPDLRLFVGGPVEQTRAWVLTSERERDLEALEVSEGVYLSASPHLIRRTLGQGPDASCRIIVGYAGWGAGQLDVELAESAWLLAPVQADVIFSGEYDKMWETVIRRLGAEPTALHGSSGVH